ncbi:hypothetical protein HK101_000864 [Irineochytrium annulatum]|nr:hypothetical protein HK101_000864 [Irineochytrium annulatum]
MPTILCFGDSLTAGTASHHPTHPYSIRLASLLGDTSCPTDGLPGDFVRPLGAEAPGFLPRLRATLAAHKPNLTIILGGTNDLSAGADEMPRVAACLGELWRACAATGSKVLALTVPETGFQEEIDVAVVLNGLIRREVDKCAREGVTVGLFDLFKSFPYMSLGDEERGKLWDADATHPTPENNDRFALKIDDS